MQAITQAGAQTGSYGAYYRINRAHPIHFVHILRDGGRKYPLRPIDYGVLTS